MGMDDREVGMLLAHVTAIDPHREIGDVTIATWADIFVGVDLTFEQAYAALRLVAKTTPAGFIGPNEIIAAAGQTPQRAKELALLARAGAPEPPPGLDQRQEREWLQHRAAAVKGGLDREAADAEATARMGLPSLRPALEAPQPHRLALIRPPVARAIDHLTTVPCSKEEAQDAAAAAAVQRPQPDGTYLGIVHSLIAGRLGANWTLGHLLATIADAEQVGWCDGYDGHDLAVVSGGRRVTFAVPRPEQEATG